MRLLDHPWAQFATSADHLEELEELHVDGGGVVQTPRLVQFFNSLAARGVNICFKKCSTYNYFIGTPDPGFFKRTAHSRPNKVSICLSDKDHLTPMMEGLLREVDMKDAEFETNLTNLTGSNNKKIWAMLRQVRRLLIWKEDEELEEEEEEVVTTSQILSTLAASAEMRDPLREVYIPKALLLKNQSWLVELGGKDALKKIPPRPWDDKVGIEAVKAPTGYRLSLKTV